MSKTSVISLTILMSFMCMCVFVCEVVCGCPWKPEEGTGSHGAGVAGDSEPRDLGAKN